MVLSSSLPFDLFILFYSQSLSFSLSHPHRVGESRILFLKNGCEEEKNQKRREVKIDGTHKEPRRCARRGDDEKTRQNTFDIAGSLRFCRNDFLCARETARHRSKEKKIRVRKKTSRIVTRWWKEKRGSRCFFIALGRERETVSDSHVLAPWTLIGCLVWAECFLLGETSVVESSGCWGRTGT